MGGKTDYGYFSDEQLPQAKAIIEAGADVDRLYTPHFKRVKKSTENRFTTV